MDRKQVADSLRQDLFYIKGAGKVTLSEAQTARIASEIEEAIKFLESDEKTFSTYPFGLLLDLGYIPDDKDSEKMIKTLETGLNRLTGSDREILIRKYKHGDNIEKIAQDLKITEKSAYELYIDALTQLSIKVRSMTKSHSRTTAAIKAAAARRRKTAAKKNADTDPKKILGEDIDMLGLSHRSCNALKRAGYMKIGDIQGISIEALKKIKGLGGLSLTEVRAKASAKGIMIITDEYV